MAEVTAKNLTRAQEDYLGRVWLDAGLGEHASVAAFGRLILDLMSLGSPPSLLARTAKAIDDEVEHARLCFGMARRFTGRTWGPGPLDLSGAIRADQEPSAIIAAAIEEGCVFETISARQAEYALSIVTDPVARRILERISVDESQHAELSWSFVEWALATFPDHKRLAIETFNAAFSDPRLRYEGQDAAEFPNQENYGALLSGSKCKIASETIQKELMPRVEALLAAC
jgi:hypothetical protein